MRAAPALHRLGERLAHHHDRVVGHDEGELAVGGPLVELGGSREQPLRGRANRLDLLRELLAERREHVLAVLADQQLVAEVPPQPRQRRAGGGLSHAKPLRRARDATLPDKLAQRDKQVEVQVREVGDGPHSPPIQRPPRTAGNVNSPPRRRRPLVPCPQQTGQKSTRASPADSVTCSLGGRDHNVTKVHTSPRDA